MPLIPFIIISAGGSLGLWSLGKAGEGTADLIDSGAKLAIVGVLGLAALYYIKK